MLKKSNILITFILTIFLMSFLVYSKSSELMTLLFMSTLIFISFFVILSLFSINNDKLKLIGFGTLCFLFIYNFYIDFELMNNNLLDALIKALLSSAVFALIYRVFSFYLEAQRKKDYIKVYRCDNELFASHLVEVLSNEEIEAFFLIKEPELFSVDNLSYEIFLKKKLDLHKANEIIELFFEKQKSINPWECPKCKEHIDAGFSICWNCQFENINQENK